MKIPEDLTTENIVAIGTAVGTGIALFNDKIRGFLLRKLSFLKSKSEIRMDAYEATDRTLELMEKRISALTIQYLELSESNNKTQKENFELKTSVSRLEYELTIVNNIIKNKCQNNCLDV